MGVLLESIFEGIIDAVKEAEEMKIYTSGASNILKYQELGDVEKATALLETFEEQGALEQLLAYGEKTAYITGGQVFSIDETDLYWAIEDEDTGFTYFAEGHGCTNDHLCGDFVDLYRGSGTDDPEFGLWKVHHETFSSFFPLGYLKDYGYILEWNIETG